MQSLPLQFISLYIHDIRIAGGKHGIGCGRNCESYIVSLLVCE